MTRTDRHIIVLLAFVSLPLWCVQGQDHLKVGVSDGRTLPVWVYLFMAEAPTTMVANDGEALPKEYVFSFEPNLSGVGNVALIDIENVGERCCSQHIDQHTAGFTEFFQNALLATPVKIQNQYESVGVTIGSDSQSAIHQTGSYNAAAITSLSEQGNASFVVQDGVYHRTEIVALSEYNRALALQRGTGNVAEIYQW